MFILKLNICLLDPNQMKHEKFEPKIFNENYIFANTTGMKNKMNIRISSHAETCRRTKYKTNHKFIAIYHHNAKFTDQILPYFNTNAVQLSRSLA